MSHSCRTSIGLALTASVLLTACATDQATSPAPQAAHTDALALSVASGPACQTISFNEGGLAHGDLVTSLALDGMTLGVSVAPYVSSGGVANPKSAVRAFDTNDQTHPEDLDLMVPPAGYCGGCAGQGNVLIIEHEKGFATDGDYRWGGAITLSGFAPGHYVKSFRVFDNESAAEAPEATIKLYVGGELVGESTRQGDGTVELVNASAIRQIPGSITFTLGTEARDGVGGSGALDDIQLCPLPNEGCTPGYWKNHLDSWSGTGLSPSATLGSVFTIPAAYASLSGVTLHAALSLGGGPGNPGAAQLLLHHAVAAMLNAGASGVAYPRTQAEIVADVNAALTGSRSTMLTLKSALDRDNNLGCPLN